jgi:hypothetical protein
LTDVGEKVGVEYRDKHKTLKKHDTTLPSH